MRIAHVTATFPPYYAGTGTVCWQNARLLAKMGHEVTVYTASRDGKKSESVDGVSIVRLPSLFRIGNAPFLPGLLRLPRYDLVHLHYPFIFGAELIWLRRRLRGQRYVLTYHNDLRWHGIRGLVFATYQRVWTTAALGGAERVIVTSSDFAAASPQLQPLIQSEPDQLIEVPNGVDTTKFHPDVAGNALADRLGLPASLGTVILFAGAMDQPHHLKGGIPELLQAFARLQQPDAMLILVGGGEMQATYRTLADGLGIGDRIVFTGWIPHEDMGQYYSLADVVAQPAVLMEAFGLVAIEAMACGKPVVVSNLPGVRSVVSDGEDGLLVQPGDADDLAQKIQWLLDHPDRAREMGARGRAKVEERYAWPVIIPKLEQVYEQVLEGD